MSDMAVASVVRHAQQHRSSALPTRGVPLSTRPLLAATAAASALLIGGAAATPALAAGSAAPAKGIGSSTLSMLNIAAGGHHFSVGQLALLSDTASSATHVATATVTPVVADGTAYGKQVITPANSPKVVPAASSPSALGSLVSVVSPSISASATNGPSTTAGAPSFGSVSLLGIDVPLSGTASLGSAVTSAQAVSQKAITLKNVSLPSIGALLASLGLDVTKLPVGTLGDLVNSLDLATSAVDTANEAVDAAQVQVDSASTALAAAQSDLAAKTAAAATAQSALTSATTALQTKLSAVSPATLLLFSGADTISGYSGLSSAGRAAVETDSPGTAAAYTAYNNATAALASANAAVATAQAAVDTAQATLTTLTGTLDTALAAVDALARPILDGTALVSLDSLSVGLTSVSKSNTLAGQTATITGGQVTGLKVLGTDVLDAVLGSSTVDLTDLVGNAAAAVTSAIGEITGTLSDVLSNVPGFPALDIPAPQVGLLTKTVKTSVEGGFGKALASVSALSIKVPAITIPAALAVPNAASLPALGGVTQAANTLTSAPISMDLLSVSDQSAFRPAVIPGTSQRPTLPRTGLPVGLTALSALAITAAVVLRRRQLQLAEI